MPSTSRIETRDHRVAITDTDRVHVIEVCDALTAKPQPTILTLHGTSGPAHGTRRWRLRLGRYLAKHGYRVFLFDSRGHGYSDGEFEDSTVSTFVDDATLVLQWIRNQPHVDSNRIGLFGFSLGSAIAVVLAHNNPDWIRALLLYTLPCDMDKGYLWYFERFSRRSLDKIYSSASGSAWIAEFGEYFTKAFLDDLSKHDVKKAIAELKMPLLLIQPNDDDQVPRWVSDQAYALKPDPKERLDIEGTHTMATEQGWNAQQEQQVTEACLRWFTENL